MKRKNREINIFSMSALDLFASAMGAFVLIAIIALPYYLKTDRTLISESKELKQQIQESTKQLATCNANNEQLQARMAQLENAFNQTYIAVVMQWGERFVDIDLHVLSPEGYEFFYKKNNQTGRDYPSSQAKLSRDTIEGPGVEVWEIPVAKEGVYKVFYKYYESHGGKYVSTVDANIYTNKGSYKVPKKRITQPEGKVLVATIRVKSNGDISFE